MKENVGVLAMVEKRAWPRSMEVGLERNGTMAQLNVLATDA